MPQLLLSQLSLQDLMCYRTAKLLMKHLTPDKSHHRLEFIQPGEICALLTGAPRGLLGLGTKHAKGFAGQYNSSENQRQLRTTPWVVPGRGVSQKASGEGGTEVSGSLGSCKMP